MKESCGHCNLTYEREPGFFLGSIYFNYGVTAAIAVAGYIAAWTTQAVPDRVIMAAALVFVVLFPLWFFRYARSLWLAFDQFWDPRE